MPLIFSSDGRQRIVPDRSVPSYQERGWDVAGDDTEPPAESDLKAEWVDYAKTRGYDESEGLTKGELIERHGR